MGIKGVKSGNMAKLRGLTEKDLFTMSREEMESLLYSTSKTITASVRKLMKSEYKNVSQFVSRRNDNKYAMPREIKLKTAKRMELEQLKQELRDLSYTANLQTYNVSGTKRMVKAFEKTTGRSIEELISVEMAKDKLIDKLIEDYKNTSGETYTKDEIIAKYGDEELNTQAEQIVSDRWVKIREEIEEQGHDSTSVIKSYDVNKEEIGGNVDELEQASEEAKQRASKDIKNSDMFNLV